jgi:hypothetical protein
MASQEENATTPLLPKAQRVHRTAISKLGLTQALSPGRIALLQLIAKFPGVSKARLLAIKGVGEPDLEYLAANDLIKLRGSSHYRATFHGETVGKRGW